MKNRLKKTGPVLEKEKGAGSDQNSPRFFLYSICVR